MFVGYREDIDLAQFDKELQGRPFAFFQPILSIEDKQIVGYEALARGKTKEGKTVSLGKIFLRHDIPLHELYSVDLAVREDAIRRFAKSGLYYKRKLFLNIMPRWLEVLNPEENLEQALPILKLIEKYGIPPSSVVLEITEGEFGLSPERFDQVICFLKSKGFSIAIDDFGAGFSNVHRIALMRPHYIKLDLHLIQKGFSDLIVREILHSIAHLCDKIGSILLLEGVETEQDFYAALDIGARYVQGYFFGHPSFEIQSLFFLDITVEEFLKDFRTRKLEEVRALLLFRETLADHFVKKAETYFRKVQINGIASLEPCNPENIPPYWHRFMRLAFVVNDYGIQISPNYRLRQNGESLYWEEERTYIGKDWSWRPYFQYFIAQKDILEKNRAISEPYRDITTGESIVTLLYQFNPGTILCLDFSVAHLEESGLKRLGLP